MLFEFFNNLIDLFLDTAIWLLLGLVIAAVLKGWIPTSLVQRWLSGKGSGSVIRAALIGAPLPLCSCGVLPAAIGLRRSGASKPATVSFLVATPETGVDSISVTYALLGPIMAIIRPFAAITSAIVSGLMILFFDREETATNTAAHSGSSDKGSGATDSCCSSSKPAIEKAGSCCGASESTATQNCSSQKEQKTSCCANQPAVERTTSCCSSDSSSGTTESESCCSKEPATPAQSGILSGIRFAIVDILDDISGWLAIGLVLAAVIATLIEPSSLSQWGSGLSAMLLMLAVGLPLYICATASTPLAAALLAAGMSPGAILVFLLVGPATNIASLGILSRELGIRAVILYLSGISICAVLLGLATDVLLNSQSLTIGVSMADHHESMMWIKWLAAITLLVLVIKPLRNLFWKTATN